jgi:hypothetical protein
MLARAHKPQAAIGPNPPLEEDDLLTIAALEGRIRTDRRQQKRIVGSKTYHHQQKRITQQEPMSAAETDRRQAETDHRQQEQVLAAGDA